MFGINLKKYRVLKKLNQGELAIRINDLIGSNYTKDNVGKWEKGTNPKLEVIGAIADILDIPEQFLFNDSNEAISKIVEKEIPNFTNMVEHTKKISLLDGYVGAGSAGIIEKVETVDYLYVDNYTIKKAYQDHDIKGLTVVGDSMSPYVDCCDIVLFAPLEEGKYNYSDGKYIITTVNGAMVKNLSFRSNGDIIISSCNKAYPPETIKSSETQEFLDIVGIVVGRILKS